MTRKLCKGRKKKGGKKEREVRMCFFSLSLDDGGRKEEGKEGGKKPTVPPVQ